jgi:8-oxo-dGTP pyrophosphatase MutT (NUDIX family)
VPTPEPWSSGASRIGYENAWIRVVEHEIEGRGNGPSHYGVVETKAAAVSIVALFDQRVCLIREYRFPLRSYLWRLPTGGAADGEDERAAAARELREETGLAAGTWSLLGRVAPMSGLSSEVASVWLADDSVRSGRPDDTGEVAEIRFVDSAELTAMMRAGEIIDGQTLAALALLSAFR